LKPWTHKIVDVLDIASLGYTYEVATTHAELMSMAREISAPAKLGRARSPFVA
jgi:hypothetical protein